MPPAPQEAALPVCRGPDGAEAKAEEGEAQCACKTPEPNSQILHNFRHTAPSARRLSLCLCSLAQLPEAGQRGSGRWHSARPTAGRAELPQKRLYPLSARRTPRAEAPFEGGSEFPLLTPSGRAPKLLSRSGNGQPGTPTVSLEFL